MASQDRRTTRWTDAELIGRVLGEYPEPGLAFTVDQAQRLWGCDAVTCRRVVDVLVDRHLLLDHCLSSLSVVGNSLRLRSSRV
jgi:hypothetical protein